MRLQNLITTLLISINSYRNSYNLQPIMFNYNVYDALDQIRKNYNDSYFYSQITNRSECIQMPYSRVNCNKLYQLRPLGFYPMCHDTYNNFGAVLKMRISQNNCFNWKKCDPKVYHGFTSCLKVNSTDVLQVGNKCVWVYHYGPKLLQRNLTEIACIWLNFNTWLSPIFQKYSFVCFSNVIYPPNSDYVF